MSKNFKVRSVSILQFSKHFPLIFDNSNVNKQETKNGGSVVFIEFISLFIICRVIKFFFLILLRKATLESKVTPTNGNSLAFLFHTSKTCSNVELFSIFSHTFFGTNFRHQNKNNVVETIQLFCWPTVKKKLLTLGVWTH